MSILPELIVFSKLKDAIDTRHHAMERFYDIEEADKDKEKNLELLKRLKDGVASREDEEAAIDLIKSRGF
jgi:hypothetical protein